MTKLILRLVRAFTPLWLRLGIHPGQLCAILQVKLTMDDRRPNAFNRVKQQKKKKKELNNGTLSLIFMSLVMGSLYLYSFWVCEDYLSGLSLYFSLFMVMLSLTLISDFTYVLIDVKDNYIILPRPVNSRTVLVARLLHIMIHLGKMVFPMALPGIIYMIIKTGAWGGFVCLIDIVLATLVCIFTINAVYLIILKFTTTERFKDIIGGVQIVFSILLISIYYIGRSSLAASIHLDQGMLLGNPYLFVIPPLWLASFWEVLRYPAGQPASVWGLAAAALVFCPGSIWVVIRHLGPGFDRKLSGLGSGTNISNAETAISGMEKKDGHKRRPATNGIYPLISKWLTRSNAEATGFEIAWLLTGRNRDFKMKVYPSFAYVLVYFFYFAVFNGKGSVTERWEHLSTTRMYIVLIYSSSLAMISAISNAVYSDKYKAAWVYYVSPVRAPGEILTGAVKAMVVKYFIPFYTLVTALAFYVWGAGVLPDMLLGLVNVTLFGVFMGFIYLKKMPFSSELSGQAQGGFMRTLFILVIPASVGGLHLLLRYMLPEDHIVIWIVLALSAILLWLVYGKYRQLTWTELDWS